MAQNPTGAHFQDLFVCLSLIYDFLLNYYDLPWLYFFNQALVSSLFNKH